ncbi:MAG: hypothetical protein HYX82_05620 [Chloroflexi bacterium]|nr:hypothetical protein [Chloroflexota bacterium]
MARHLTRQELYRLKEEFHRKQARLPYLRKLKILMELQEWAKIWKQGVSRR